jgi:hypothetical protein
MFLTRAERRRVRRRRRLFLFFALVIALAAIASALDQSHAHPGHRSHTRGRVASGPGHPASAKAAKQPARPESPPSATGTGLDWADFHGIQLPQSAESGPRHTRGGLAWGFAHTQEGALLAAINIAVRTAAQWGPGIYQSTTLPRCSKPMPAAMPRCEPPPTSVPGSRPDVGTPLRLASGLWPTPRPTPLRTSSPRAPALAE